MDNLLIDGKNFVKTTRLAKELKYTADYLGQLCRSKKIESRLIGRSWYINPESFREFISLKTAKNVTRSDEKTFNSNPKTHLSVDPAINKKTIRYAEIRKNNFSNRINWSPIKYTPDSNDLLPNVGLSKKLKVELEDAKSLRVKSAEVNQNLIATELPEVSLKGTLNVTSLETTIPEIDNLNPDLLSENLDKRNISDETFNDSDFIIKKPINVEEKENIEKIDTIKKIFFAVTSFALTLILLSTVFLELEIKINHEGLLETNYILSSDLISF